MADNEKELIERCKRLDVSAQKEVYQKYNSYFRAIIYRYAYRIIDIEDILQEGFIKIFLNIRSFKWNKSGSFIMWMKTIIINTAITYYNKNKKREKDISIDDLLYGENNENINNLSIADYEVVDNADISEQELMEILNTIPIDFRIVFSMNVIEGYKHKEIAKKLNIKEKTSRTRLLRAKQILQKQLAKICDTSMFEKKE